MHPIRPTIYDAAYWLTFLVLSPYFAFKFATSRRWRTGFRARLGLAPLPKPKRPVLWVHGVSVGEVLAAKTLVEALGREFPGYDLLVSSTTPEGFRVAQKSYRDCHVCYYPIDTSFVVSHFFRRLRPAAALLIELEIWPNFLLMARYLKVPVAIVNGRISDTSFPRYHRFRHAMAHIFNSAQLYCVQTPRYAERLVSLGVKPAKVHVTGSLKYDTIALPEAPESAEALRAEFGLSADTRLLIGGSTHAPEEAVLLDAFAILRREFPALRLVLVPRHLTRADEVEQLARARGFQVTRRSRGAATKLVSPHEDRDTVRLVDTIGELGRLYHLAEVVYVGGSLSDRGGQNMLEPAGLGKPVVFGPHVWNFQEAVDRLLWRRGAHMVRDASELTGVLRRLFANPLEAQALGERAKAAVTEAQGATARTIALLRRVLR